MRKLLIRIIERYQNAGGGSKLLGVECNFSPSCSEYAKIAVTDHGIFSGIGISVGRIRRCRERDVPVKKSDPVPQPMR